MTLTSAGATVAMHGEGLTPQQQSTLVERIRRLEAPAEEELVHLFSNRVAFLVRTRTRDPEAARDLTQEVLLAVVLALRNGHLREAERLAAFVYGTARNVINNYLRTRSRSPREDAIDDDLHPANLARTRLKTRSVLPWSEMRSAFWIPSIAGFCCSRWSRV